MVRVFVSAPYSAPTPEGVLANVEAAIDCGQRLDATGVITAYVPHLYHWWDKRHPGSYERWIAKCLEEVRRSDAVLRLAPCPGGDREVALARECGVTVFESEERVILWARWTVGETVR